MLGRMILAGLPPQPGDLASPADYSVANKAAWDAVFANSAATLSGKVVEITAPITESVTIINKDFQAAGAPVTIRSANAAAYLSHLVMRTLVRGVDFSGLYFQMTGWPSAQPACVQFATGIYDKLRWINGTSFRHGYGPLLANIDTAADLPEYTRVPNVRTATTTSATYPLTWQDPAATSAGIEFFNRGSQTVYVAVGNSGVTATTGSTACAAGQRVRLSPRNPTIDTHFAVLAASGTVEVNARTEIGLSYYLANAFFAEGAADIRDIEIRNCIFRDLLNGAKSLGNPTRAIIMDNDFDRIYADVMAVAPRAGGIARILRNTTSLQFCRSGIPEASNGDAGDPHGDVFQMFSTGAATITGVIIAGTRMYVRPVRTGVANQGMFISDNDFAPSFTGISLVSNTLIGGLSAQIASGETLYPIRDFLIYGNTIVDWSNAASPSPRVDLITDNGGSIYVGSTIAGTFRNVLDMFMLDNTVQIATAASPGTIFPSIANLQGATTRTQIEAALTTAGEGEGIGAVATANVINWTTTDPEAVVFWEKIPSGVHWNTLNQQDVDSVITLPLRKVLNPRASQAVAVASGTEWRSVDIDGNTEIQSWTGSPGTIQPGQFIQIRRQSAASAGSPVIASVTINGFTQNVAIVTSTAPTQFLVQGATPGYFVDPVNPGVGLSRITASFKINLPTTFTTGTCKPLAQVSTGCDLVFFPNGLVTAIVEDSTGAKMLNGALIAPIGTITKNQWHDIVFDVDQGAQRAVLTVDGANFVVPFTAAGSGLFQLLKLSFLATSTGGTPVPAGTKVADMSLEFNGVMRKAISNMAASANADEWKLGTGSFTDPP